MRWFYALFYLMAATPLQAEYEYAGHGQYIDGNGKSHQFDFGLALRKQQQQYLFRLGQQQMTVAESPGRYTLALVLNQQQQVWVADFSSAPVSGFDWQLGPHHLKLFKDSHSQLFKLQIDQNLYQFTAKKRGQIHFILSETGIKEIRVESMLMQGR